MSLSAASILLALAFNGQLSADDEAIIKRIQPSVVTIYGNGVATGMASAFGPVGRFVAHRTAAVGPELSIRFQSGRFAKVKITSQDDLTGLVLLEFDTPAPTTSRGFGGGSAGTASGASSATLGGAPSNLKASDLSSKVVVSQRSFQGQTLYVFSLGGVNRAELTSNERFGINSSSRRALTFSEIRFESQPGPLGGALAFNSEGHLVGILGATLEGTNSSPNLLNAQRVQSDLQKSLDQDSRQYGPSSMTVAYSVTPDIIQRVLDGFASESRKVEHPALGILVQDGGEGAKIVSVTKGSTADKGGLHANDIITEMNGSKIGSQFDYTKFLIHRKVGETLQVTIVRDKEVKTLSIVVGA